LTLNFCKNNFGRRTELIGIFQKGRWPIQPRSEEKPVKADASMVMERSETS